MVLSEKMGEPTSTASKPHSLSELLKVEPFGKLDTPMQKNPQGSDLFRLLNPHVSSCFPIQSPMFMLKSSIFPQVSQCFPTFPPVFPIKSPTFFPKYRPCQPPLTYPPLPMFPMAIQKLHQGCQ